VVRRFVCPASTCTSRRDPKPLHPIVIKGIGLIPMGKGYE
jgi:hypothetical protein